VTPAGRSLYCAAVASTGRVFLLSPAHCGGERARLLLSERAQFDLARRLRSPTGAPLGEVFSFLSGLYFRGKLAYARAFARAPRAAGRGAADGVLVITPGAGLWPADTPVDLEILRAFAAVDVAVANARYREPLEETAHTLRRRLGARGEAVLLGSIASAKYVDVLGAVFGERLLFPPEFVGRGDMSRGGLLLRCARAGSELPYVPVLGAVRHGPRPPRLGPLPRRG
jgi:hypothetical protein